MSGITDQDILELFGDEAAPAPTTKAEKKKAKEEKASIERALASVLPSPDAEPPADEDEDEDEEEQRTRRREYKKKKVKDKAAEIASLRQQIERYRDDPALAEPLAKNKYGPRQFARALRLTKLEDLENELDYIDSQLQAKADQQLAEGLVRPALEWTEVIGCKVGFNVQGLAGSLAQNPAFHLHVARLRAQTLGGLSLGHLSPAKSIALSVVMAGAELHERNTKRLKYNLDGPPRGPALQGPPPQLALPAPGPPTPTAQAAPPAAQPARADNVA
jgi:hypothetical protein